MAKLAAAAHLSVSTIKRFEDGGAAAVSDDAIALIQDALETEGVRFLADDGDGPGGEMSSAEAVTAAPAVVRHAGAAASRTPGERSASSIHHA